MRGAVICLASALAVAGCSGGPSTPSEVVSSIALTAPPLIYLGQTSALSVIATHPDGTTHDVTALAKWSSSAASVAAVSAAGVATGAAAGTTIVSATYQGASATASIQVFPTSFTGPSSVRLVIDGVSFVLSSVTVKSSAGLSDIEGVTSDPILFHVVSPMTTGVYDVSASVRNGNLDLFTAGGIWIADGVGHGGAGVISVVNATSNRLSGTFTGTVNGAQGTAGTKSITDGVFDVIF